MENSDIDFKVQKGRMSVILDEPFWAYLLLHTELIRDDSIETACTDGEKIWWSGIFFEKLSVPEIKFVLVHELAHKAFFHHLRRQARQPRRFNYAADYVINWEIKKINDEVKRKDKDADIPFPFPKPPFSPLLDPKYANKSTEEVYNLLPEENSREGKKLYGQGPSIGEVIDAMDNNGKPLSKEEKDKIETEIKQMVAAAANIAQGKGNLPANLKRIVQEIIEPKKNWRQLLKEYFLDVSREDYSWTRPNRRFLHTNFILPSLESKNQCSKIAIIIDTSGSIFGDLLKEFISEVKGITYQCNPAGIIMMSCDTDIYDYKEYDIDDELPTELKGGGGTDFRKPFIELEERQEDIMAVLYFTDLMGTFGSEPKWPVLWCVPKEYAKTPIPFGSIIELD